MRLTENDKEARQTEACLSERAAWVGPYYFLWPSVDVKESVVCTEGAWLADAGGPNKGATADGPVH